MQSDRKIARQILYVLKGLRPGKLRLTDIELLYHNGAIVGCKVEIKQEKETHLKLVRNKKKQA